MNSSSNCSLKNVKLEMYEMTCFFKTVLSRFGSHVAGTATCKRSMRVNNTSPYGKMFVQLFDTLCIFCILFLSGKGGGIDRVHLFF